MSSTMGLECAGGRRAANCSAMYSMHGRSCCGPVYSGKAIVSGLVSISCSNKSFLFRIRNTGVSAKSGFAIVSSNSLRLSCSLLTLLSSNSTEQ